MKIIILNGPPRSGKDTAANAVEAYFGDDVCRHIKFSQPLKDIAASALGHSKEVLEQNKDDQLLGMTISYRQAQIKIFESMSEIFGDDWLGKWLLNSLDNYEQSNFIISDGGRYADVSALLERLNPSDLMIVQIMREGCLFDDDIRTYISARNVRTRPILNKDIETFKAEMIDFAGEFFGDI